MNNGYKWSLVGLDSFSKYAWTAPLKDINADSVVEAIENIFLLSNSRAILHTDNGKEFVNSKVADICIKWKLSEMLGEGHGAHGFKNKLKG